MKLRKQILLSAVLILSLAQPNTSHAQNVDTRKGYDLRGHGFDSSISFIVRQNPQLPVIVRLVTDDAQLTENIKNIIRKLDNDGYENIALLLGDKNLDAQYKEYNSNVITFYRIGDPIAALVKGDGNWYIVFVKTGKMEGIMLEANESKYPNTLIKLLIKKLFKN